MARTLLNLLEAVVISAPLTFFMVLFENLNHKAWLRNPHMYHHCTSAGEMAWNSIQIVFFVWIALMLWSLVRGKFLKKKSTETCK
jgi:hypothetical protein